MAEPSPTSPPSPPSPPTPTSTTFITYPLYGGALTVSLPSSYVDASQLRQIPSHQELFVSSTTLTSVLFEIDDFVQPSSTPVVPLGSIPNPNDDLQACQTHFHDPITTPDRGITRNFYRVMMEHPGLRTYAAYVVRGEIVLGAVGATTTNDHAENATDTTVTTTDATDTADGPHPTSATTHTPYHANTILTTLLLLRLPHVHTDIVVRISIPPAELIEKDLPGGDLPGDALRTEERLADQILEKIIETLDVVDWGVFGE